MTVQAVDKNGASLTYLDDLGVTQLVKVTLDAGSIAPVRNATIAETNCATSCGIGQCVSACEHSCSTGKCKDLCQCQCKILKHNENPECYQNAPTECAP